MHYALGSRTIDAHTAAAPLCRSIHFAQTIAENDPSLHALCTRLTEHQRAHDSCSTVSVHTFCLNNRRNDPSLHALYTGLTKHRRWDSRVRERVWVRLRRTHFLLRVPIQKNFRRTDWRGPGAVGCGTSRSRVKISGKSVRWRSVRPPHARARARAAQAPENKASVNWWPTSVATYTARGAHPP